VASAKGGRWETLPLCIVPERGQVPENSVEPSASECGNVLHEHVTGSKLANNSGVFNPETRARAFLDAGALAGDADVLARKAATDEINGFEKPPPNGSDIVESLNARPTRSQNPSRIFVPFHLPKGFHPGALKPELKPTDSAEQTSDGQAHSFTRSIPSALESGTVLMWRRFETGSVIHTSACVSFVAGRAAK
jgi:hypothetical protein